jgi:hypothetical protein
MEVRIAVAATAIPSELLLRSMDAETPAAL